jgi:DMSO reductase family type II enzyme heme b subunit
MVKVKRVSIGDEGLLDPAADAWQGVVATRLTLQPTPLAAQPSKYIQVKWEEAQYGLTPDVSVQAAHNGERIYFRMAWQDGSTDDAIRDTDQFADAAALLFPVNGDAPLQSMGSPQLPVNAWYWRPDLEQPFSVTAQGTGTTRRAVDPALAASARHHGDEWTLVVRRSLGAAGPDQVTLTPGSGSKIAFAVWQGANHERGGLKAVTLDWEPLEVEA